MASSCTRIERSLAKRMRFWMPNKRKRPGSVVGKGYAGFRRASWREGWGFGDLHSGGRRSLRIIQSRLYTPPVNLQEGDPHFVTRSNTFRDNLEHFQESRDGMLATGHNFQAETEVFWQLASLAIIVETIKATPSLRLISGSQSCEQRR